MSMLRENATFDAHARINEVAKPLAAKLMRQLADFYEEDKTRWTQGYWATDAEGRSCEVRSRHAHSFCLVGGLERLELSGVVRQFAYNILNDSCDCMTLSSFNDDPGTKVEDVIRLLRSTAAK